MDAVSIVAAVASAVAAIAAWRSSATSQQAVRRSNLPYVWPAVHLDYTDGRPKVYVRLHNDGPGLAQDVVAARLEPLGEDGSNWQPVARTATFRAIRSGETLPPADAEALFLGVHLVGDDIFSVAVRWTDTAGERWELIAPQSQNELTTAASQLRRRFWQRRRLPREDW
jgi:hypothetical protein